MTPHEKDVLDENLIISWVIVILIIVGWAINITLIKDTNTKVEAQLDYMERRIELLNKRMVRVDSLTIKLLEAHDWAFTSK